jgi:hypothetical protein
LFNAQIADEATGDSSGETLGDIVGLLGTGEWVGFGRGEAREVEHGWSTKMLRRYRSITDDLNEFNSCHFTMILMCRKNS